MLSNQFFKHSRKKNLSTCRPTVFRISRGKKNVACKNKLLKYDISMGLLFLTGNSEKIREVLTSMLAGNAFFLHSNPPSLFQSQTYIKSRDEHTLYHEAGKPLPFMVILLK